MHRRRVPQQLSRQWGQGLSWPSIGDIVSNNVSGAEVERKALDVTVMPVKAFLVTAPIAVMHAERALCMLLCVVCSMIRTGSEPGFSFGCAVVHAVVGAGFVPWSGAGQRAACCPAVRLIGTWVPTMGLEAGVRGGWALDACAKPLLARGCSSPLPTPLHPPLPSPPLLSSPASASVSANPEKSSLESLTNTLGVPLGTAKAMVFKKRALLQLAPDEILNRVRKVADVVGVTTDQAIDMVTIQPGLLFDTQVCVWGGEAGPFEGRAREGYREEETTGLWDSVSPSAIDAVRSKSSA